MAFRTSAITYEKPLNNEQFHSISDGGPHRVQTIALGCAYAAGTRRSTRVIEILRVPGLVKAMKG
jgi:hypothetical protein